MKLISQPFYKSVSVKQIDYGLTSFSLESIPKLLLQSIQSTNIINPLGLISFGDRFKVVCGNRRLRVAQELNLLEVPARIFSENISYEDQLLLNIEDNLTHRSYSDLEIGSILLRLTKLGIEEKLLIHQYMPILGLERSKKLVMDFLKAGKLSDELKTFLHEIKAPLKTFIILLSWNKKSQNAVENFLKSINPGVNKMRELLGLINEIAQRDNISPVQVIEREDIQSILKNNSPMRRYNLIYYTLFLLRFPKLSAMRKEITLALDKLKLDPKTKIYTDENFEKDDIRIELNFKTLQELECQMEKLSRATQSSAMKELIAFFTAFRVG